MNNTSRRDVTGSIRLRDGRVVDDLDLTDGESADATLRRVVGLRL